MADILPHVWQPHPRMPYIELAGSRDSLVRTKPAPDGRYLWQFRRVVGYAATVDQAREYVEAGAEFFGAMHRNPYA